MRVILGFLTTKLLAILGGGGVLGVGARLIGWDRKAVDLAKRIPPKGWLVIAIVVALVIGFFVHRHYVHKLIADTKAEQKLADDTAWQKAFEKERQAAALWKRAAELRSNQISHEERTRDEEAIHRDAVDADALSLRGPGAAASHCGPLSDPGAGAGASGREPSPAQPNAPGSSLPAGDWARVPWSWLVQRAQEHDDGLAENIAWRNNDTRQRQGTVAATASPPK